MNRKTWQSIVSPVVVCLLILAGWQILFLARVVEPILLPSPASVLEAFVDRPRALFEATRLTAVAAAAGFGLSLLLGTLTAFVFSQSRLIRDGCYPYAIFLQTVPIVAIAFGLWPTRPGEGGPEDREGAGGE